MKIGAKKAKLKKICPVEAKKRGEGNENKGETYGAENITCRRRIQIKFKHF